MSCLQTTMFIHLLSFRCGVLILTLYKTLNLKTKNSAFHTVVVSKLMHIWSLFFSKKRKTHEEAINLTYKQFLIYRCQLVDIAKRTKDNRCPHKHFYINWFLVFIPPPHSHTHTHTQMKPSLPWMWNKSTSNIFLENIKIYEMGTKVVSF